jgi:hypothetical protein
MHAHKSQQIAIVYKLSDTALAKRLQAAEPILPRPGATCAGSAGGNCCNSSAAASGAAAAVAFHQAVPQPHLPLLQLLPQDLSGMLQPVPV